MTSLTHNVVTASSTLFLPLSTLDATYHPVSSQASVLRQLMVQSAEALHYNVLVLFTCIKTVVHLEFLYKGGQTNVEEFRGGGLGGDAAYLGIL